MPLKDYYMRRFFFPFLGMIYIRTVLQLDGKLQTVYDNLKSRHKTGVSLEAHFLKIIGEIPSGPVALLACPLGKNTSNGLLAYYYFRNSGIDRD
ncbi:hypothetical protein JTB14_034133 [Gonioctena quinquepunctata]|nr:hypothetical protein JTB14_034133 [Gonioctena quinquepunctata]